MADEGAFELEPLKPAMPAASSSLPSAPPPKPGTTAPNATLNAPGLLNDFDEDADFSDPGPSARPAGPAAAPRPDISALLSPIVTDASVIPFLGNVKALGITGGLLLVVAVIITAIANTSMRPLIPPLITLYEGLVHTGTGVVAVLVAARFAERRLNRVDLVAARMLVLVALFLGVNNLNIPIPGRIEEFLLAGAVYYGALLLLFRLPTFETGIIGGTHFCLWVLMKLGALMYEVNRATPAVAPAAGG